MIKESLTFSVHLKGIGLIWRVCFCIMGIVGYAAAVLGQDLPATPNASGTIEALPFDELPLYKIVGLSKNGVLNFRVEPKSGARIKDQLPAGLGALPVLERKGAWALISHCKVEGWVSFEFLALQSLDEPRIQDCASGPVDPYPKTKIPDKVAEITLDASEIQADTDALDVTDTERDLGQATLSTAYALCLADAGKNKARQTQCLIDENSRWETDIDIAFNLIAATLPFQSMRKLRDAQRIWAKSVEILCEEEGLAEAEPFTRFHIPTCKLKLTFQRAIALEEMLQADQSLSFDERLTILDANEDQKTARP